LSEGSWIAGCGSAAVVAWSPPPAFPAMTSRAKTARTHTHHFFQIGFFCFGGADSGPSG
jgi:hypothetical protein